MMHPEERAVLDAAVAWYDGGGEEFAYEDPMFSNLSGAVQAYREALPRIAAAESAAARLAQDWDGGWRQ